MRFSNSGPSLATKLAVFSMMAAKVRRKKT
jgi:hypothetical protein